MHLSHRYLHASLFILAIAAPLLAQPPVPPTKREQIYTGQPPAPAPRTWVDDVKNPTEWLKWGADLRNRYEYINNQGFDGGAAGHEWSVFRFRSRLWLDVTPVSNLDVNLRVVREDRHWEEPSSRPDWDWPDTTLDTANVKLSNLFGTHSSLTLGRQDILNLGDGWLLFEGTPLDGSRTLFFNAARLTLADVLPAKTTLDIIYLQANSNPDDPIQTLGGRDVPLSEQDERGGALYLVNKAIDKTQIDAYFIYKHDDRQLANGDDSDLYTLGGRVARELSDHWRVRGEGAYQFGHRLNPVVYPNATDGSVSAFGGLGRLSYLFNDSLKNQLKLTYEYESGDDPNTDQNEAFDPLWGRWPQFSEIWLYNARTETRIGETTNLQRLSVGWQMNPTKKLELCADYGVLFANENTYAGRSGFSSGGDFRGQLFTAVLRYTFNRFVSGNLMGEHFLPGDYYASPRGDAATYLRAEIMLTF